MHRLYFHRVLASQDISDYSDLHDPTAAELDQFLAAHKNKFHFVSSAQVCACLDRGQRPDPRWIHLSMDDGFASSLLAAEICASHDAPLTVFVTSGVLDGLVPWFTRRVAALAGAEAPLTFLGRSYDPKDHGQALALHDAIKQAVYAHPTAEQPAACDEILRGMGLEPGAMPEKLRFMTPEELKRLAGMGVEIGAHGASHVSLLGLSPDDAAKELRQAKHRIEEILSTPINLLSYPEGLFDQRLMEQAWQAGFQAAFAVDSPQPNHLYCLGRSFAGRGMLDAVMANSPQGVRPKGESFRGPWPTYARQASSPLRVALLSFAPQNDAVNCLMRRKIIEAYPETITVAKVNLTHDQARSAFAKAEVIPAAVPVPAMQATTGVSPDKLTPQALFQRLELRAQGLSHGQGALAQVLRQYFGLRKQGRSAASAITQAPARHAAWQRIVGLETQVARARTDRFPAQGFGPDDCQIIFPADGNIYALAARLKDLEVDVAVQLGWGLVQLPILEVGWGVLSLHHGMMPQIRGALTPAWAVIEKRPEWLGITLQRLEAGMDTGQIVSRLPLDPAQATDYLDAYLTLDQWSFDMMMAALEGLARGEDIISDPNPNPTQGQYRGLPSLTELKRFSENQAEFFGPGGQG